MISARVSAKGQITLPERVRQALEVKPGDRVLFVVEDKRVVLQPMSPGSARTLAGSLRRYAGAQPDTLPAREVVKKEVARAAAQEG